MSLFQFVTKPQQADTAIPQQYTPLQGHNLLSQGLCYAQIFTGLYNRTFQGLVDGYKGSLASAASWQGPLLNLATAGSPAIGYGSNPQTQDLALGAFSVFARVRPTTNSSGGLCRRNDGNSVNQGWQLTCNTSGTRLDFVRSVADLTVITSATPITTGVWNTVGMSYPGDLTATSVKFYHNGVVQAHSSDVNGSGTQGTDATQAFDAGESNFSTGAGTFQGIIDCLYIWRRFVRQEEYMLLHANPYLPVYSNGFRAAAALTVENIVAPPPVGGQALFFAV